MWFARNASREKCPKRLPKFSTSGRHVRAHSCCWPARVRRRRCAVAQAKSKMKPSLLLTNTTLPAALTRNQRLNFVHENIPNIDLVGLRPIQDSEVRKFHQSCCKTTVGTFAYFYSNSTQTPFMHLQCFAKENQQSPVYVVNCQFSRSSDRF